MPAQSSTIKLRLIGLGVVILACLVYAGLKPSSVQKTFRTENLKFNEQTTLIFCLESLTESSLLSKTTRKFPPVEQYHQEKNYQQKIRTCNADFDEAIAHDEIIESALYKGQLDDFFKRVQTEETSRVLMLNLSKLPKALAAQLKAFSKDQNLQLTAFDIALATKRINDVVATMPDPNTILPHQRYALFHLGVFSTLAHASVKNDQTIAEDKLNDYQAQMHVAIATANPQLAATALSELSGIMRNTDGGNSYTDYRGGFSDYDFFIANRDCDVAYASFLVNQQILPSAQHVLHLLSTIGHAQYPETAPQFSNNSFMYANPAFGIPSAAALPQCVTLARLYANQVQDLNDPNLQYSHGYFQTNVYDEIYKSANDAVFQWWVSADERQYHGGRISNTVVHGDPAILIEATAEILKKQAPSFEQYCAWANHAHTWTALVKKSQPQMVAPMLDLPQQWKQAPFIYQRPQGTCNLSFGITEEYEHPNDGVAFMNKALKQAKIPCQGMLIKEAGTYQLTCQSNTKPWPAPTPNSPLSAP